VEEFLNSFSEQQCTVCIRLGMTALCNLRLSPRPPDVRTHTDIQTGQSLPPLSVICQICLPPQCRHGENKRSIFPMALRRLRSLIYGEVWPQPLPSGGLARDISRIRVPMHHHIFVSEPLIIQQLEEEDS